jgi:hypothetical protein
MIAEMILASGAGMELYGRIRPRLVKSRLFVSSVRWAAVRDRAGKTSSAFISDESATPTQVTSAAALESH